MSSGTAVPLSPTKLPHTPSQCDPDSRTGQYKKHDAGSYYTGTDQRSRNTAAQGAPSQSSTSTWDSRASFAWSRYNSRRDISRQNQDKGLNLSTAALHVGTPVGATGAGGITVEPRHVAIRFRAKRVFVVFVVIEVI